MIYYLVSREFIKDRRRALVSRPLSECVAALGVCVFSEKRRVSGHAAGPTGSVR
jgi:hypothetical protein